MAQEFTSEDAPFFKWMNNNPDGFVLNTKKSEKSSYAYFHKSNCGHIGGPIEGNGSNPYTSKDYIKVCSTDPKDLLNWIKLNRENAIEHAVNCKDCNPDIDLDSINMAYPSEQHIPSHMEGAKKEVTVNRYERDRKARKKCLEHHGYNCAVCEMNFEERYEGLEANPIHVHHLDPISQANGEREVDPKKDLVPVCPNCHAVIHATSSIYSIEEVKEMLQN
ncbi:MAG: HNH endonuclease [Balneolaceae bacterium]|nr:HNH endonuclease [Balneolaceae bacterium]